MTAAAQLLAVIDLYRTGQSYGQIAKTVDLPIWTVRRAIPEHLRRKQGRPPKEIKTLHLNGPGKAKELLCKIDITKTTDIRHDPISLLKNPRGFQPYLLCPACAAAFEDAY